MLVHMWDLGIVMHLSYRNFRPKQLFDIIVKSYLFNFFLFILCFIYPSFFLIFLFFIIMFPCIPFLICFLGFTIIYLFHPQFFYNYFYLFSQKTYLLFSNIFLPFQNYLLYIPQSY